MKRASFCCLYQEDLPSIRSLSGREGTKYAESGMYPSVTKVILLTRFKFYKPVETTLFGKGDARITDGCS